MAITTNDLRNGMTLDLGEGLFSVVEFQHVKPGKGGAFVRTKLKNVRTGAVIERTYRADEKLDQALIDKREMQFLYLDGEAYVFMDTTDYEQTNAARASLGMNGETARTAAPNAGAADRAGMLDERVDGGEEARVPG